MTTDTVRQRLSLTRLAGPRARAVARDTSTASRHVVLGLRIAGTAPFRWAAALAAGVGDGASARARRSCRRAAAGTGRATRSAAGAAGAGAGRAVAGGLSGAGRAVRAVAGATAGGLAAVGRGARRVAGGAVRGAGRACRSVGRGVRGAAGRTRRRVPAWWPVVVCALAGALAGAAYGLLKAPEYTATSYVMVTSDDSSGGSATLGYAQAYGRIATGGAVLNRARTSSIPVSALESGVEVVTSPDAPMIEITGTSGAPRRAADMANRVAKALTGIANLSSKDTGADLRVFSEALTPDTPASPSPPLSIAVGACAGGLLGALLLLVRPRGDGGRRALEVASVPAAADRATKRETVRGTNAADTKKNAKETV